MAKPKLALIPAAQGSKFYSVLPSSGVGDFDFTRSGSATRINSQGLIETVGNGVSRLNYPLIDGKVVGCPHHILEPSRTNLITYSEDFSNAYWTKNGTASVTSNTTISPDGTLSASTLSGATGGTLSNVLVRTLYGLTTEFTLSVYVKSLGASTMSLIMRNGVNGVIQRQSISLNDEWQRVELSHTIQDGQIAFGNSDGSFAIWGAQLEQGSYSTSYIPTNGSSVTRSAETANGSGDASTFNDSEGVFMAELLWTATSSNIYISIDDNTSNNRILIYSTSTDDIKALVGSGGFTQAAFTATNQDPTTFNKVAVKYKQNDLALWINGIKLLTDTLGSTPIGLSNLGFRAGGGTNPLHGSAKQIQYFDSALTDSELEQLTSWVSFSDMANGQLYTIQ